MRTRTRLAVIVTFAALPLLGAAPGSAHSIQTTTPSGQENSQFLGGPGNPHHAGHSGGGTGNGHARACEGAEQNSSVDFHGGSCD